MPEVNEAVIATYLAGGNTRQIRGALQPLLKAAPLSKGAVSRVVATLRDGLVAWRTRSLTDLDVIYVYLDGFALRVRSAGKVVSVPVLGVVGVLTDGHKCLLALELCGGESFGAWKGCLDDLVARGLRTPVLAIIDGNPGLRRAVGEVWPRAAVQRCCVHKLRNLERKRPKHALTEIRDDFHRIAYAVSADAAPSAYVRFERVWAKRCPGVVASLREGGDEVLTFFTFPKAQWKTLRTTNTIERLHEEFRRRVKRRAPCQARTRPSCCSSASWRAGKSGCGKLMAGRRSRPCSRSRPREPHDEPPPAAVALSRIRVGCEDPGATLHGLARYQGEADPRVEL